MSDESSLISEIIETHTLSMREWYTGELETLCGRCESPIERVFGAALLHECFACNEFRFTLYEYKKDWEAVASGPGRKAVIIPQYDVGHYRCDFFVSVVDFNGQSLKIAIECDGHDYHERTKEQARKDKARDRWLQSNGYIILRFTGSEIWKDPVVCAEQVLTLIFTRLYFGK